VCQGSDVGPNIDKAFLKKWGYKECDQSGNGQILNMDVQDGTYDADTGAVQLKWFGHGLKGVYSEVNGVPQIYWPQNKNVWKCITGLEHALDTSKASKGGKKWYDGLTNDATQTHPGLDFSSM